MCAACMAGTCTVHGKNAKPMRIVYVPTVLIAEQRDRLIRDIAARYGITLHPGSDIDEILGSHGDIDALDEAVLSDERLDALGRGYYLGAGGLVQIVYVPAWTLDPASVAMARAVAVIRRPFRRVTRWLARTLDRG